MRKRNIFIFLVLLLLIELIVLSLRHSSDKQVVSTAEIKHFDKKSIENNIRLKSGMSIEDYIEEHIKVGNRIKQYTRANKPEEEKPKSKKAVQIKYEPGVELTYKVMHGDTLKILAERYHTTPYQIKKLNRLNDSDTLKVGQKIKIIPEQKPTYRVQKGDTLAKIARSFGVTIDDIKKLNDIQEEHKIWIGQKLEMPISQEKIDAVLAEIERKKLEVIERKKRYQRQLLARLARQKMARERKKKAKEEKKRSAKRRSARLEKAKKTFKYTPQGKFKHKIRVAATAYTSHRDQTDSTPFLAAWNNRIRPGMKIIAVSPDLIRKYGITNGVRVKISGLPGTYVVRDKMNARLHDHIDIYMGTDRKRALRWGHRRVVMYY